MKPASKSPARDAAIRALLGHSSLQELWKHNTTLRAMARETKHPAFRAVANIVEAACIVAVTS